MAGIFLPGTAGVATADIELSISARNILDMDIFSKSDPMCVIYTKSFSRDMWKEIGRTECITNNLNPDFATKVNIQYFFEQQQFINSRCMTWTVIPEC